MASQWRVARRLVDEWETAIQKKVPPDDTLAGSGKFKILCQCTDSPGTVFLREGAMETFDDSGILRTERSIPRFDPDGSFLDAIGCFDFVPLSTKVSATTSGSLATFERSLTRAKITPPRRTWTWG